VLSMDVVAVIVAVAFFVALLYLVEAVDRV
jgi:hypothetical protein